MTFFSYSSADWGGFSATQISTCFSVLYTSLFDEQRQHWLKKDRIAIHVCEVTIWVFTECNFWATFPESYNIQDCHNDDHGKATLQQIWEELKDIVGPICSKQKPHNRLLYIYTWTDLKGDFLINNCFHENQLYLMNNLTLICYSVEHSTGRTCQIGDSPVW